jgi:hypothetical protein
MEFLEIDKDRLLPHPSEINLSSSQWDPSLHIFAGCFNVLRVSVDEMIEFTLITIILKVNSTYSLEAAEGTIAQIRCFWLK